MKTCTSPSGAPVRSATLLLLWFSACGAPPVEVAAVPTVIVVEEPPPPDCRHTPEPGAMPMSLESWVRASRDAGVRPLADLGGISGGFQAVVGAARLNLRPLGGAFAMPQIELETEPGALTTLNLGDAARWPTAMEALDGQPVHLGSPLGPIAVRGAFEVDVTGDHVPDAVFALTAAGHRAGPADEDAFLATRDMEIGNAYTVFLVVDPMRRAAHTLPLQAAHHFRVHGTDGLEQQRRVAYLATLPPALPWTQPFVLLWREVSRASDSQSGLRRQRILGGKWRYRVQAYGSPFERQETCRQGP